MLRRSFVFGALLAITLVAANGCQSCSSCHDYDPPVANCHCGGCSQCGCNGGCSSCGCNGGCSSCNGGTVMQPAESTEGTPVQGQVVMPRDNTQSTPQPSGTR